jgi:hypothetical protein
MKKWLLALAQVLLLCLWVYTTHAAGSGLLTDTDTRVLITRIEQRGNPWSWFTGDWPLFNHFYRPVVTLVFEADHAFYGWDGTGYGRTNALLCIGTVLALFWLVREMFDRPIYAAGAAGLFALWHLPVSTLTVLTWVPYLFLAIAFGCLFLTGRRWQSAVLLAALGFGLSTEIMSINPFRGGMMEWIPGRTASSMTLFCFVAMAAYARYERLSAKRSLLPEPGPLDPPATQNTVISDSKASWSVVMWPVFAVLAGWCAFSSYEQAVMLPACLLGVAVAMRMRGFRVRWAWQVPFWSLIPTYLLVRNYFVERERSDYQSQQLRFGDDVYYTLADYILPFARTLRQFVVNFQVDPLTAVVMFMVPVMLVVLVVSHATWIREVVQSRGKRDRELAVLVLSGFVLSFLAFLPMAWLKPFASYNHYHYFSMGLRSLFVFGWILLLVQLTKTAMSRPAQKAPPRPVPAPGSLPHP